MIYFHLFIEFLKIGLLAIGGGLASIPFLNELAVKHDWFTAEELALMIAVSESTPGPLGVNMATYAGFSAAGIAGGIAATLFLVLPSVLVVLIITRFMKRFGESRTVQGMFRVLRPAAVGLIAGALFTLLTMSVTNAETGGISLQSAALYAALTAAYAFTELKKLNLHPIIFIIAGAAAGIATG
jgi:chromate transporter